MRPDSASPVIPFLIACAGIATFSAMDVLMKGLSIDIGAYNAVLWRTGAGTILSGAIYFTSRPTMPDRATLRIHAVRSLFVAGMAVSFFWALARLPMAEAIASHGHRGVHFEPDKARVVDRLEALVQPGDVVIALGAGDINQSVRALHQRLAPLPPPVVGGRLGPRDDRQRHAQVPLGARPVAILALAHGLLKEPLRGERAAAALAPCHRLVADEVRGHGDEGQRPEEAPDRAMPAVSQLHGRDDSVRLRRAASGGRAAGPLAPR